MKKLQEKAVQWVLIIAAIVGGCFHFYTGGIGTFSSMFQTVFHWTVMFAMVFFLFPKGKKRGVFDWALFLGALTVGIYILLTWKSRVNRISPILSDIELIMGFLLIFLVLEATRRCTGNFLAITAGLFIVYAFVGPWLPGIFYHKGYSIHRLVSVLCYAENGIFGSALSTCATFIVLFILFGAFLNGCNGGKLFIDIAYSFTGWARGGPAKTAILSSLFMGSISGSPVANVVTTGTFTIPLMKDSGYESDEACAVEAVASTGGQIMPPVMGAAAFIMADYTGIAYGELCLSAFIPALLYYASVFFIVDFISLKRNLLGKPKSELPNSMETIRRGGHLFIPIVALVICLIIGYSLMKTVFFAIIALLIVAQFRAETRIGLHGIFESVCNGIQSAVPVAVACSAAGIIVGVVGLTGLGVKFSSSLISLSNGNLIVALFYTMIASLILGCGLPTTAVYIVLASMAAPALVEMGIPILAAHMFVFYFGCISTITPPVALTSYAASGIGDASPSKTGIKAFLFGLVAYIVPYMFALSPTLLLMGDWMSIVQNLFTALAGVYILAAGVAGYLRGPLSVALRGILMGCGILMIHPAGFTDVLGIAVFALVFFINRPKNKKG